MARYQRMMVKAADWDEKLDDSPVRLVSRQALVDGLHAKKCEWCHGTLTKNGLHRKCQVCGLHGHCPKFCG